MKICCIIPVFNMAGTVAAAIRSAFSAGIDDVVVVDDCSTDDTADVLASFGSDITVWRWPRKPPDWVLAQRVAWDAHKADHYVWLGADDTLLPALGQAIRDNADAGVVLTDYLVVSPCGNPLWPVSQDVNETVWLTPEEMRDRMRSREIATESGSGSSIRGDVAAWLWRSGFAVMGPHADSIGYATAACMFGCALVPVVGATYTFTPTSYARNPAATPDDRMRAGVTCREWMASVGLDDDTAKALARKRVGLTW